MLTRLQIWPFSGVKDNEIACVFHEAILTPYGSHFRGESLPGSFGTVCKRAKKTPRSGSRESPVL